MSTERNPRQSIFSVGVVDVTYNQTNGSLVDLHIKQEGHVNEAAFAVIAAEAIKRFGKRVKPEIGQGWTGPHSIRISLAAGTDEETGVAFPAISADDIKTMLKELGQQYASGPVLEKAARALTKERGKA